MKSETLGAGPNIAFYSSPGNSNVHLGLRATGLPHLRASPLRAENMLYAFSYPHLSLM